MAGRDLLVGVFFSLLAPGWAGVALAEKAEKAGARGLLGRSLPFHTSRPFARPALLAPPFARSFRRGRVLLLFLYDHDPRTLLFVSSSRVFGQHRPLLLRRVPSHARSNTLPPFEPSSLRPLPSPFCRPTLDASNPQAELSWPPLRERSGTPGVGRLWPGGRARRRRVG